MSKVLLNLINKHVEANESNVEDRKALSDMFYRTIKEEISAVVKDELILEVEKKAKTKMKIQNARLFFEVVILGFISAFIIGMVVNQATEICAALKGDITVNMSLTGIYLSVFLGLSLIILGFIYWGKVDNVIKELEIS